MKLSESGINITGYELVYRSCNIAPVEVDIVVLFCCSIGDDGVFDYQYL